MRRCRAKQLDNTKRLVHPAYSSSDFVVPQRPSELELKLFIDTFFLEDRDEEYIYDTYISDISKFCWININESRDVRLDIGVRTAIKNLAYYVTYFHHKVKSLCLDVNSRSANFDLYGGYSNSSIMEYGVRISYSDHKNAIDSKYEDFLFGYITILKRDDYMELPKPNKCYAKSIVFTGMISDYFKKRKDTYTKIASIRMKHPILTVDNYEKIYSLYDMLFPNT
nr:MAG TPA: hypothetical protein [Caudoviricetes sp.]